MGMTSHGVIELRRPAPRRPRILCVDDDAAILKLLIRRLGRAGYDAVGVSDPLSALEQLVATPSPFHALVTDQNMKGMMGLELASVAARVSPGLVVFLATAASDRLDPDELATSRVSYLVAKPFDFAGLVATLGEATRPSRSVRPSRV